MEEDMRTLGSGALVWPWVNIEFVIQGDKPRRTISDISIRKGLSGMLRLFPPSNSKLPPLYYGCALMVCYEVVTSMANWTVMLISATLAWVFLCLELNTNIIVCDKSYLGLSSGNNLNAYRGLKLEMWVQLVKQLDIQIYLKPQQENHNNFYTILNMTAHFCIGLHIKTNLPSLQ